MDVQVSEQQEGAATRVPLLSLFAVFFRIGAFSFGGGLTGWVYREVVLIRPWMKEEEFLSSMALSQIMPGANITNLSVCVGLHTRGVIGATVAFLALLTAPFFAVIGLFTLYSQAAGLDWLTVALQGVTAAAIGLLMMTVWKGGQSTLRSVRAVLAFAATFVMIGILHWPLVPVVFGVGFASVAAAWPRKGHDA